MNDMMLGKMNDYGVSIPLPDEAEPADVVIELEGEAPEVEFDADGNIIVSGSTTEVAVTTGKHTDNLALTLNDEQLAKIGEDICSRVEADLKSRQPWFDRYAKGLERLGIYDVTGTVNALGATDVTHPLLIEAATQFQARAMAELYPPSGPVKGSVVGRKTPEKLSQATRVEQALNYELTIGDRTYYDEQDSQLFRLAFSGSEFQKVYRCPLKKKMVSRWIHAEDFIAPYGASDLVSAPRYTHSISLSRNEYRRYVAAGFYRDIDVQEADEDEGQEAVREAIDTIQGEAEPVSTHEDTDEDLVFYETHIDYDIPGCECEVAQPYIITVDKATRKVLSIYRNWRENDPSAEKRIWFTHRKFLPGFGFYGFGLIHAIGGLADTATQIIRVLLDAGAFATLQGGFKSKDAKIKGGIVLTPGVWQDTEMSAEELQRMFYTPDFKEPSEVLFRLLGVVVEGGQRFASTTETMVGDAATTGPVGTMVAQIEQGSKVFSGIHKRLHKALGDEFILFAEGYAEGLPEFGLTDTDEGPIMAADFDGRVDVVPVSDPNIYSSAQRIAMSQTALQLSQSMPDISDRREAAVGLLRAMRFPDPARVFPAKREAERADPVTEGSLAVLGKPLMAYLDQAHDAHLQVHMLQMQQLPPPFQPAMQAHIMEHIAMQMRLQYQQQMGIGLPPVNFHPEEGQPAVTPLPPEIENQIAMRAAQVAQQIMAQQQQAQQAAQQQEGGQDPRQAQAEMAAEQQRKDAAFAADQKRKDAAAMAAVDRKDALAGLSPELVRQAEEFINKTGITMSPRELALLSKTLGKPFVETVAAVSRMLAEGQGGSQFPQAAEVAAMNPRFR